MVEGKQDSTWDKAKDEYNNRSQAMSNDIKDTDFNKQDSWTDTMRKGREVTRQLGQELTKSSDDVKEDISKSDHPIKK
jgi:hypothetical protein